jgi:hypothetical protein
MNSDGFPQEKENIIDKVGKFGLVKGHKRIL